MAYHAKKRLGQHFLVDRNICRRLVRSVNLRPEQVVLEIGPGRGALTHTLLETAQRVVAVEVDPELAHFLQSEFEQELKYGEFALIVEDILRTDIRSILQQEGIEGTVRIFGNLPYNIATAVVQHMIEFRSHIEDMTLMLQREVVDRILSPPGSKQYGYLSVVVQYYCEAQKLFNLSPGVFRPVPQVTSTVVHLKIRRTPLVQVNDETHFFQLVGALFTERRKTVLNNLKRSAQQFHCENAEQQLRNVGIDPARRAETLGLEEFAQLANELRSSD